MCVDTCCVIGTHGLSTNGHQSTVGVNESLLVGHHVQGDMMVGVPARAVLLLCCGIVVLVVSCTSQETWKLDFCLSSRSEFGV